MGISGSKVHNHPARRRVVVTGVGIVAPNGIGVGDFWEATRNARSGIGPIDRFPTDDYFTRIAGLVAGFDPLDFMPRSVVRMTDRSTHFALAASAMAVRDAGLDFEADAAGRAGVSLGAGLGGMYFYEEQILQAQSLGMKKASPRCVPRITPNAPAAYVAVQHGLRGPNITTSTACSSGAHAVGLGCRTIRSGDADVMICGGTDACILAHTFRAFDALRVMSTRNDEPCRASRPFDADRDGFVMGEGGAIVVLEEMTRARERGATPYCELAGYGASCGAHHIVIPVEDGGDAARAVRAALDDAGLSPGEVDAIVAHGTGTRANDAAEAGAIRGVFGDRAAAVPVSSTKSVIGHTLGAAGAVDAVVCALALRDGIVPPTANCDTPDPKCGLNAVPDRARRVPLTAMISNAFGFGNNNAVLAYRKQQEKPS